MSTKKDTAKQEEEAKKAKKLQKSKGSLKAAFAAALTDDPVPVEEKNEPSFKEQLAAEKVPPKKVDEKKAKVELPSNKPAEVTDSRLQYTADGKLIFNSTRQQNQPKRPPPSFLLKK